MLAIRAKVSGSLLNPKNYLINLFIYLFGTLGPNYKLQRNYCSYIESSHQQNIKLTKVIKNNHS